MKEEKNMNIVKELIKKIQIGKRYRKNVLSIVLFTLVLSVCFIGWNIFNGYGESAFAAEIPNSNGLFYSFDEPTGTLTLTGTTDLTGSEICSLYRDLDEYGSAKKLVFDFSITNTDMSCLCYRLEYWVEEVVLTERFDTSNVLNMSKMFSDMRCVRKLDISHLDTSSATNMEQMFASFAMDSEYIAFKYDYYLSKGYDKAYCESNSTNFKNEFKALSGRDDTYYSEPTEILFPDVLIHSTCENVNLMFYGLKYLEELDLSGSEISCSGLMFGDNQNLKRIILPNSATDDLEVDINHTGSWQGFEDEDDTTSNGIKYQDVPSKVDGTLTEIRRIWDIEEMTFDGYDENDCMYTFDIGKFKGNTFAKYYKDPNDSSKYDGGTVLFVNIGAFENNYWESLEFSHYFCLDNQGNLALSSWDDEYNSASWINYVFPDYLKDAEWLLTDDNYSDEYKMEKHYSINYDNPYYTIISPLSILNNAADNKIYKVDAYAKNMEKVPLSGGLFNGLYQLKELKFDKIKILKEYNGMRPQLNGLENCRIDFTDFDFNNLDDSLGYFQNHLYYANESNQVLDFSEVEYSYNDGVLLFNPFIVDKIYPPKEIYMQNNESGKFSIYSKFSVIPVMYEAYNSDEELLGYSPYMLDKKHSLDSFNVSNLANSANGEVEYLKVRTDLIFEAAYMCYLDALDEYPHSDDPVKEIDSGWDWRAYKQNWQIFDMLLWFNKFDENSIYNKYIDYSMFEKYNGFKWWLQDAADWYEPPMDMSLYLADAFKYVQSKLKSDTNERGELIFDHKISNFGEDEADFNLMKESFNEITRKMFVPDYEIFFDNIEEKVTYLDKLRVRIVNNVEDEFKRLITIAFGTKTVEDIIVYNDDYDYVYVSVKDYTEDDVFEIISCLSAYNNTNNNHYYNDDYEVEVNNLTDPDKSYYEFEFTSDENYIDISSSCWLANLWSYLDMDTNAFFTNSSINDVTYTLTLSDDFNLDDLSDEDVIFTITDEKIKYKDFDNVSKSATVVQNLAGTIYNYGEFSFSFFNDFYALVNNKSRNPQGSIKVNVKFPKKVELVTSDYLISKVKENTRGLMEMYPSLNYVDFDYYVNLSSDMCKYKVFDKYTVCQNIPYVSLGYITPNYTTTIWGAGDMALNESGSYYGDFNYLSDFKNVDRGTVDIDNINSDEDVEQIIQNGLLNEYQLEFTCDPEDIAWDYPGLKSYGKLEFDESNWTIGNIVIFSNYSEGYPTIINSDSNICFDKTGDVALSYFSNVIAEGMGTQFYKHFRSLFVNKLDLTKPQSNDKIEITCDALLKDDGPYDIDDVKEALNVKYTNNTNDEIELALDEDFEIEMPEGLTTLTDAGTYTLKLKGINNCEGERDLKVSVVNNTNPRTINITQEGETTLGSILPNTQVIATENSYTFTLTLNNAKCSIYVDGVLSNTLTTSGSFTLTDIFANGETIALKVVYEKINNNTGGGGTSGGGSGGSSKPAPKDDKQKDDEVKYEHRAYIDGYEDGSFRPNSFMTRAELCKIVALLSDKFNEEEINDYKDSLNKYKDVNKDEWYAPYVGFLTKNKYVQGYGDTFNPNGQITRTEVCIVLENMFDIKDKGIEKQFTDLTSDRWFFDYVNKMVRAGLLNGYPDETIKPNANMTRSEIVTLVNRVSGRTIDKELKDVDEIFIKKLKEKFNDVPDYEWYFKEVLEAAIEHNPENY